MITVRIATKKDYCYAEIISKELNTSAANRGVQIKNRTPKYILDKMETGLAIVAINSETEEWIGFSTLEVWEHEQFVANTGLIIAPKYRGHGFSMLIKSKLFELSRQKYPKAKIFSLTGNPNIIQINQTLGFTTVPFSTILNDNLFLTGCNSWVNYSEIMRHSSGHVAMVYAPIAESQKEFKIKFGQYLTNKLRSFGKKTVRVA